MYESVKKFVLILFILITVSLVSINAQTTNDSIIEVNTFEQLKKSIEENNIHQIKINNNIEFSETITVDSKVKIMATKSVILSRESDFEGILFNVNMHGDLELGENLLLDGELKKTLNSTPAIMNGGILTINGADVKNFIGTVTAALITKANSKTYFNSGVLSNNTSFGGTLDVNSGGAIRLLGNSYMEMNGGIIENNQSNTRGGGVGAVENSTFVLNGGIIRNNKVIHPSSTGGGIYISISASFKMENAIIEGNISEFNGGGIQIGTGNDTEDEERGIHNIVSGKILNNTAKGGAGGGINIPSAYTPLHLKKVFIANNKSAYGGGVYICPTGILITYITNGAAIINNIATMAGNDLLVNSKVPDKVNDTFKIDGRILGGIKQQTFQDGILIEHSITNRHETNSSQKPLNINDFPKIQYLFLKNLPDKKYDADNTITELSKKEATLIIEGNESGIYGGGIGSNSRLIIGEENKSKRINVTMKTGIQCNISDSINVNLVRINGNERKIIETAVLSKNNNWSYSFENLPGEYNYEITEGNKKDYQSTIKLTKKVENTFWYQIDNCDKDKLINISGMKIWDDNDNIYGKRPKEIIINLLADGNEIKEYKVSAQSNWKYSFANLPLSKNNRQIKYTVKEDNVNDYMSMVNGYNVTNKFIGKPKTPKTGNNSLYIAGMLIFASTLLGCVLNQKIEWNKIS